MDFAVDVVELDCFVGVGYTVWLGRLLDCLRVLDLLVCLVFVMYKDLFLMQLVCSYCFDLVVVCSVCLLVCFGVGIFGKPLSFASLRLVGA